MLTKDFRCGYAGATEYDIRQDGRVIGRVEVRDNGNRDMPWNDGVWESDILPGIGTVRWENSDKWGEFPPAEVVALFPGYVGARLLLHPRTPHPTLRDEGYKFPRIEWQYNGPKPQLCPHPNVPNYVTFVR